MAYSFPKLRDFFVHDAQTDEWYARLDLMPPSIKLAALISDVPFLIFEDKDAYLKECDLKTIYPEVHESLQTFKARPDLDSKRH